MSNTATTEAWTDSSTHDKREKTEEIERKQECWADLKSHLRALCKKCGADYFQVEELIFAYATEVEGEAFFHGIKVATRLAGECYSQPATPEKRAEK